jgi:hypothetical protein
MKLEDIHKEWNVDAEIKSTEILEANLATPRFLQKYLQYRSNENLLLKKLQYEYRQLRFDKWIFYVQGPNEESKKRGWKLPPKGAILKSEVDTYLDVDPDISELTLKIDYVKEKIDVLTNIIKQLHDRNWTIKNHISWATWTGGA